MQTRLISTRPELCFLNTAKVMCCFEDNVSHLEGKVENRERGEEEEEEMGHP